MIIKDSISFSFIQIANVHRMNLEKLMAEVGLHAGQVLVLESLWESDCQSQADLVRNLSVTAPTVCNLVVRLGKAGFVEIKKCEKDARLARVCLLQKGLEIKFLVEIQWGKLENAMVKNLSETEKLIFSLLLQKIRL